MSDATGQQGVKQWIRRVSIIVASPNGEGIELSDLHCVFKTQARLDTTPANCLVQVYNPSPTTVARLLDQRITPVVGPFAEEPSIGGGNDPSKAKLIVQAGYEGNFGILFRGDIIQVKRTWVSMTDWTLDIFAGDSDYAHNWAAVNTSLAAGYRLDVYLDQLRRAYAVYGVNIDDLPSDIEQPAAPRGRTIFGMARDHVRRLQFTTSRPAAYRDNRLQWMPQSGYLPDQTVVVNATTGMIQVPNQTNHGVEVKMLLNPSVGQYTRIRINNKSVNQMQISPVVGEGAQNLNAGGNTLAKNIDDTTDGDYFVLFVTHEGDTRGTAWYTTADCAALDPVQPWGYNNVPFGRLMVPEG